jgi:uncharacterized membrane protein YozB (DUF420 family)
MTPCLLFVAGWVSRLPAINALLNAAAAVLLLAGYMLIKRRREHAHKLVMLLAFATSAVFLTCYLIYHRQVGHVAFGGPAAVRYLYLAMLASHVILAAAVPVLAMGTIYLGLADRRAGHRRLAHWTFPIWLYVSFTGIAVYLVLYHLYPPPTANAKIEVSTSFPAIEFVSNA